MKETSVFLVALLVVSIGVPSVHGAGGTTNSMLHVLTDDFVANDTANLTVSVGSVDGDIDVSLDSLDRVNVFLCDSENVDDSAATENEGRCWNGTGFVNGNTEAYAQRWLNKSDALGGCEEVVIRCEFINESLPDQAGETFTLDVRAEATDGLDTLFYQNERFVTFESNASNGSVVTHDHNISGFNVTEMNEILFWGVVIGLGMYLNLPLVALAGTVTIFGTFVEGSWPVSNTFGLLLGLLGLWLHYAARNFKLGERIGGGLF